MSQGFYIAQYDLLKPLVAVLSDEEGAVDLSAATGVNFEFVGHGVSFRRAAAITDAVAGQVTFTWASPDTDVAGKNYKGRFIVTWSGGKKQSFPNSDYIAILISPALVAP